jgi:hypothetical protein
MGLLALEGLGATSGLPWVRRLSPAGRRCVAGGALTILVCLSAVEVAMALMRDGLMADKAAIRRALSSHDAVDATAAAVVHAAGTILAKYPWIGAVAQVGLSFVLPWSALLAAGSFEDVVEAGRVVLIRGSVRAARRVRAGVLHGVACVAELATIALHRPPGPAGNIATAQPPADLTATGALELPGDACRPSRLGPREVAGRR